MTLLVDHFDHFVGLALKGLRILFSFNTDKTMVLEEIVEFCRMNFLKMLISPKLQIHNIFSNL